MRWEPSDRTDHQATGLRRPVHWAVAAAVALSATLLGGVAIASAATSGAGTTPAVLLSAPTGHHSSFVADPTPPVTADVAARPARTVHVATVEPETARAAAHAASHPAAVVHPVAVVNPAVGHVTSGPAATRPAAVPATAVPAAVHATAVPAATPESAALASALATRSNVPAASPLAASSGCGAAISYLGAHSAPGFQFQCPGDALGHQAMTCIDVAGVCPGVKLIVIADACPAAYMNEAHNSWVLSGLATGPIDPYGYCH
jgi:hypothetical protein